MAIKARNPISPHGRGNAPIGEGGKGRRVGPACVTLAAWAESVPHTAMNDSYSQPQNPLPHS